MGTLQIASYKDIELLWKEQNVKVINIQGKPKILYYLGDDISVIFNPLKDSLDIKNKVIRSPLYSSNVIAVEQLTAFGIYIEQNEVDSIKEYDANRFRDISNRFLWVTDYEDYPIQGVMLLNSQWHIFERLWDEYPFKNAIYGIFKLSSDQVSRLMKNQVLSLMKGFKEWTINDYTLGHFYKSARYSNRDRGALPSWVNENRYLQSYICPDTKDLIGIVKI